MRMILDVGMTYRSNFDIDIDQYDSYDIRSYYENEAFVKMTFC